MRYSSFSHPIAASKFPYKKVNRILLLGVISVFSLSACSAENAEATDKTAPNPSTPTQVQESPVLENQVQESQEQTVAASTSTSTTATPDSAAVQAKTETVASTASIERGQKLFVQCKSCHTVDKGGPNRVGPNLYGIYGSEAGKGEGFKYSKAMLASQVIWDNENLNGYLEKPSKFIPGNRMAFGGIKNPDKRADMIAYLESLKD